MTKCEYTDCAKNASFNIVGNKTPLFCATHKSGEMVNVINKTCLEVGCGQRPSFNILGQKPTYCGTHKFDGMVNVMSKFCETSGCMVTPIYNLPDKKTGRYCATHKTIGMINVVNNSCESDGCLRSPSCNLPGQTRARFCMEHKLEGMIDVKHKRCLHEGCSLAPSYGNIGTKVPKYCSAHKLEGMKNVKHATCEYNNCSSIPSFNNVGENKARYCFLHKLEGMIDTVHKKCEMTDCDLRPIYNFINEITPRFCSTHKLDGMVDIISKKCLSTWCSTNSSSSKYEGYCMFCYINLFPDKPVSRNYKTKEKAVVDYILECFPDVTWRTDKRIQDGCSKRRPDLLLDLGTQIIIIEIDENQHTNYDCSCENKRLMEISQDNGHRNIVFIRFNPDDYNSRDGNKIKSCWSINKQGISIIHKNNKKEWSERLKNLKAQIQYWIDNTTDKMVEVVQLYYDE